ncbi:hypothetical protein J3Y18_003593, partial [Salmonella enterica]|nr:hypothetical protein [Salmonella enterica]
VKGKVLDAAHFELLKHAYELQEHNISQLKTNNAALKESNELLKERSKGIEDKVEQLEDELHQVNGIDNTQLLYGLQAVRCLIRCVPLSATLAHFSFSGYKKTAGRR